MSKMALAIILALGASTSVAGGLYKCTDPSTGAVTFSQTQCYPDWVEIQEQVKSAGSSAGVPISG